MHDDNLKKINSVLGEFYQENKLQNGLLEVDVANACKDALGSNLLQYVNDISFQNELKLALSSASLRQELAMKEKWRAHNNQFGTAVVKKVYCFSKSRAVKSENRFEAAFFTVVSVNCVFTILVA